MTERNTAVHTPVLLREVIRGLELRPGLIVVDGTVGAGGHSRLIAAQIGDDGLLIGLDRDPMMLGLAAAVLPVSDRVVLKHASYVELPKVIQELGLQSVDRVLLDLGLSSDQLADRSRHGRRAAGSQVRYEPRKTS
jgi:16S rRNA (cytosine1402-N4)-methyltransferase